jgi:hypothetical protein
LSRRGMAAKLFLLSDLAIKGDEAPVDFLKKLNKIFMICTRVLVDSQSWDRGDNEGPNKFHRRSKYRAKSLA